MTKLFNFVKQLNLISNNIHKQLNNRSVQIENNYSYSVLRRYCETKIKCWKCGVEKKSYNIFCEKCKVIQKPQHTDNYFKLLGIDEAFDVDVKDLVQKFRGLQNLLHPDKYSNRSSDEKEISQEYSSILNRAYTSLSSPIQRGLYLLSLKGEQIDEKDTNTNKNFLIEIMEMNEEVEEADTVEKLKNLDRKNRALLDNITKELSIAFNKNDVLEAKNVLIKMKYYYSISKQINSILREKGIVE